MSQVSAFLNPVSTIKEAEIIPSERFKNPDGTFATWKIHSITEHQNRIIIKDTTHNGIRDDKEYNLQLLLATVSEPRLDDEKLCQKYNAYEPGEVALKMLLPGEFAAVMKAITEICGFESNRDIYVKAKN